MHKIYNGWLKEKKCYATGGDCRKKNLFYTSMIFSLFEYDD